MALKKDFLNSTKYYYASISHLALGKNAEGSEYGVDHQLNIKLAIKDYDDPNLFLIENELSYAIPAVKLKVIKVYNSIIKMNEEGTEPVMDEEGELIYEDVEVGEEEVIDETYSNPLTVETMNVAGQNPYKIVYEWIKDNVELFRDFEDC